MDKYKTITQRSEGVFREKGSKFIAYASPVEDEDAFKVFLEEIKKEHHSARHFCYAWQFGPEGKLYRANDDGEPGGTAGKPILGQIRSFELTNVGIIVVRYFGGTKLGTSGLITAYKESAKEALSSAKIAIKELRNYFIIKFQYNDMSQISSILNQTNAAFHRQDFEMECEWEISVDDSNKEAFTTLVENLHLVSSKFIERR